MMMVVEWDLFAVKTELRRGIDHVALLLGESQRGPELVDVAREERP